MHWTLAVYGIGVVAGLWRTDAPVATRVALALLWPLGPLAFVITVSGLMAAALIAFPLFGAIAAAGSLAWWLW